MSFFVTPDPSPHTVSAAGAPAPATTFLDILYDFRGYLEANEGCIGEPFANTPSIAVIGAGPAGLLAAYQLVQLGASVVVFEASDKYSGRVDSYQPFPVDDPNVIFELGAMRVPPSEQLYNYYHDTFGGQKPIPFPDPGVVNTQVIYQNTAYWWKGNPKDPAKTAPAIFKKVSADWDAFAGQTAMVDLATWLGNGDYTSVQSLWQQMLSSGYPPVKNWPPPTSPLTGWNQISFFAGLRQQFPHWAESDLSLFGSLGLGSGGFAPLYPVNFAEIVRLLPNGLESDQKFYTQGLKWVFDRMVNTPVGPGGKKLIDVIAFNSEVTEVKSIADGTVQVTANGSTATYNAAVVATTNRSMQVDMGITIDDPQRGAALTPEQNTAIRKLHLMNSSKLCVATKTKFWRGSTTIPQNIQTDGLCRGLYGLEYEGTDKGVVIVSYTWGDDSTKCIAIKDPVQRLDVLLTSLEAHSAEFVAALRENLILSSIKMIDWQDEKNYYGAFKLNYPGQDVLNQSSYYQFINNSSNGIFLAGDSIGWSAGWIECALQTGMNAAAAVANYVGGTLFSGSPMEQDPNLYNYGP